MAIDTPTLRSLLATFLKDDRLIRAFEQWGRVTDDTEDAAAQALANAAEALITAVMIQQIDAQAPFEQIMAPDLSESPGTFALAPIMAPGTLTAGTALTGGGNMGGNIGLRLADTAVTPGSYGSSSTVGVFTVDQQGRLSAASSVAITPTAIGGVPSSRQINTSAPLTGGGDLSANRTIGITGSALTKADDTNVTLTLGGAPSTALLGAVSLTLGWSGQLAAGRGGTGSAFTQFAGPASSVKTFTLPNASDAIGCLGQANTWTANQTFGNGTGSPQTSIDGGTGTAGPYMRVKKAGGTIGYFGADSAINAVNNDDLQLFAVNTLKLTSTAGPVEVTGRIDQTGDRVRIRAAKTPSSASDTGNQGEVCWDSSYLYVCVASNSWKRTAISTW